MDHKKLVWSVAGILLFSGLLGGITAVRAEKKTEANEPYLLVFNAPWCGPCQRMNPLMDRLEKEEGVHLERYGINTSTGNLKFQEWGAKTDPPCAAIPYFVNTRTRKAICGTTDYPHLRSWALEVPKK